MGDKDKLTMGVVHPDPVPHEPKSMAAAAYDLVCSQTELRQERDALAARVKVLEGALREILRDTDEPFGFASYAEAYDFAERVLGVARAALAPPTDKETP